MDLYLVLPIVSSVLGGLRLVASGCEAVWRVTSGSLTWVYCRPSGPQNVKVLVVCCWAELGFETFGMSAVPTRCIALV